MTYLCNLAGTEYELPEDDTVVSKHAGAVGFTIEITEDLLVHCTKCTFICLLLFY